MAITKIILQQMVTMDQNSITASKYPKYTVVLSNSISSITAGELTAAIESSKASAAAAKQSEINAKQSELNAKDSENEAEISAASSQQSATQSASSATASANSAKAAKTSETNAKASETAAKTSETNAKASETAAKTSETNANSSKTAAAASASAAKTSETNAAAYASAAKTSETNAKTSETNAANSAKAAKTSETNAKTSETNAAASAARAESVASDMKGTIGLGDSPRDCPDISGNPSNFLGFLRIYETAKGFPSIAVGETVLTGFISGTDGVPSFAGLFVGSSTRAVYSYRWRPESGPLWTKNARIDDVNRLVQIANDQTRLYAGNGTTYIEVGNNRAWGVYDSALNKWQALGIAQGGTGAMTAEEARTNLGLGRNSAPTLGNLNLLMENDAAQASSGILSQYLRDTSGVQRARSRIYSEIRGDNKAWLTLHIQSDTGTNKYAGLSTDGNFQITGSFIGNAISLSDVATSKVNLQVNRFVQATGETDVVNHAGTAQVFITDNKNWGAYDKELKRHIALPISQGGTGGLSISEAKTNLQIPSVGAGDLIEIAAPAGVEAGKYYPIIINAQYGSLYVSGFFIDIQTRSSVGSDPMNSCTFNGFIKTGGWSDRKDSGYGYYNRYASNELALKCILVSAKNAEDKLAVYVEGRAFPVRMRLPQFFTATAVASSATYGEVTYAWGTTDPAGESTGTNTLFDFSLNRVGFYQASTEGNYYIGSGQRIVLSNGMNVGDELSLYAPKITFSGTIASGNGVIADGISVSNATFYSRYRVGDIVYGAEFRASESAGQIIVRDPAGTNHQFFNFNSNGTFSPPGGLLSSTGTDWNTQHNTINKFYGIAGQTNSPDNGLTVHGGIHVGFSGNYATQFAGRNNRYYCRSVEQGKLGYWYKLFTRREGSLSSTESINDLTGELDGIYYQGTNAQAKPELGYPIDRAGTLIVWKNNGGGGQGCTQMYITLHGDIYTRVRTIRTTEEGWVWMAWRKVSTADYNGIIPAENGISVNSATMDWNTLHSDSALKMLPAVGSANGPSSGITCPGIHIGHGSGYGQIAIGYDNIYFRNSGSGGTNKWIRLARLQEHNTFENTNYFLKDLTLYDTACSLTLQNSKNASQNGYIQLWGNLTGRATVVETKLANGYLYYGQLNEDNSRLFSINGYGVATAWNTASDRDLKNNITVIDGATESLRKMHGYTYTLKENGMPFAGVIAQEVMEALPEAVSSFYKYEDLDGPTQDGSTLRGEERYYSVDYNAIVGLLVQVNRESDNRITALESEVSDLKKQIADLTLVVNSLLANRA